MARERTPPSASGTRTNLNLFRSAMLDTTLSGSENQSRLVLRWEVPVVFRSAPGTAGIPFLKTDKEKTDNGDRGDHHHDDDKYNEQFAGMKVGEEG